MSNYATKTDSENVAVTDTSIFAPQSNLSSLKPEVDKLDMAKLKPIPVDLSRLSDVVKIDVLKKTKYKTYV